MEPTNRPFPLAPGGAPNIGLRSLRQGVGPAGADVRQPDLGGAPKVQTISGLGVEAGAYVRNQGSGADQSQGMVIVRTGAAPSTTGTIVLAFGATVTAAQYWCAAEWASLVLSAAGAALTITWTSTRPLRPFEPIHLAYQWSVSQ
jgi:hypothetical protein